MPNEQVNLSPSGSGRFDLRLVAVLGLICAAVLGGYFVMRTTPQNGQAQDANNTQDDPPKPYFRGWGKPDLAIVVSGEMHGYTQPCGCSFPQYGGLARRYKFLNSLRDKGWEIVAVDLGDIAADPGLLPTRQAMLKYELSMKALDLMKYSAVGLGRRELQMPLKEALAHYSLNNPTPIPLTANLAEARKDGQFYEMHVRQHHVASAGKFKVGIVGAVGQDTVDEVNKALTPQLRKDMQFLDNPKVIPEALDEFAKNKVDVSMLLYQGLEIEPFQSGKKRTEEERRANSEAFRCAEFLHEARKKNAKLAPVQLLVCLSDDDEPPGAFFVHASFPDTRIVTIGRKSKYVGVVGVWKKDGGLEFKYDIVPIGPEFEPKEADKNPVAKEMEDYALNVKVQNLMAEFRRNPHPTQIDRKKGVFDGTDRCADCHQHAYNVWQMSGHSHAFDTLEKKAKNPSLRQFDGECVLCHTVGFQYNTGYYDPPKGATAKQIEKHNLKLRNVGCESCHGPASEHANNPNDPSLYPLINPYRAKKDETPAQKERRMRMLDNFCQKCHDIENDVHWNQVPFEKRWQKIAHPTPKKNGN